MKDEGSLCQKKGNPHIVHGDNNCNGQRGCPIVTISVSKAMSISWLDATIKVSLVSSPFSVNFSSSMKGSSVKLLGWARVVTRPSRAARVTSTGTMERAIIALTALTASSALDYITWICWSVSLFVSPLFSASTTLTSHSLSHPTLLFTQSETE